MPIETQIVKVGRRATDPIIEVPKESIMAKAQADVKAAAFKAASKTAAKKGIVKPKHESSLAPGESAPGVKGIFPAASNFISSGPNAGRVKSGIDNNGALVVQSNLHQPNGDSEMTDQTTKTDADLPQATKDKMAATAAKIEAKAAKLAAAEKKKADALAAKEAKAAEREAAQSLSKEQREAKAAAAAEARKAANPDGKRTYFGTMLSLSDKVKAGAYAKGLNGQLRSDDEVARTLEVVTPANVVKLLLEVLCIVTNPYEHLNIGQQSMNLRNKLRGALRAEEGAGLIVKPGTETEPPVRATITRLKELRDAHGYATEEDAVTKKREAKEAKEKAKTEADAAKAAAKQKAADEKAKAKEAKAKEAKKAEAPAA